MIPLFRSRHAPEFTARGVANGVFWGLTPTVGLQTLAIAATWLVGRKLLRADSSLVQALVWAWVNNPFTMLPMYYVFYRTGIWLMGDAGSGAGYASFLAVWNGAEAGWVERITTMAGAVGVPTLIGCLPYAGFGSVLSYCWAIAIIRRRRARLARRAL